MDFSPASDQPPGVGRRPFSCKAAHLRAPCSCSSSASLETESDDAVLLHRKISRSEGRIAAAHPPAPRRGRKKGAIDITAANVVSSSIIFLLLFFLFLASVSEEVKPIKENGSPPVPKRSRKSASPQSRSPSSHRRSPFRRRKLSNETSRETEPDLTNSATPRKYDASHEHSVKELNKHLASMKLSQNNTGGSMQIGKKSHDASSSQDNDSFAYVNEEGTRVVYQGKKRFTFRMTFCRDPTKEPIKMFNKLQNVNRVSLYIGNEELETEGLRQSNDYVGDSLANIDLDNLQKLIKAAIEKSSNRFAEGSPVEMNRAEIQGMDKNFSHVWAVGTKTSGAVLLIWKSEIAPYKNSYNIGMVYSAAPEVTNENSEMKLPDIRESTKNVLKLLTHYNTKLMARKDFPIIGEYHAELIGANTDPYKSHATAEKNLDGYQDAHTIYTPFINLGYSGGRFLQAVYSNEFESLRIVEGYRIQRERSPALKLNIPFDSTNDSEHTELQIEPECFESSLMGLRMKLRGGPKIYSEESRFNRISLLFGESDFRLEGEQQYSNAFWNILKRTFDLDRIKEMLKAALQLAIDDKTGQVFEAKAPERKCEGIALVLVRRSTYVAEYGIGWKTAPFSEAEAPPVPQQPADSGIAILVIWRPEKDPYNNHANIGMMYVVRPNISSLLENLKLIEATAKSTIVLLNYYNTRYVEKGYPKIKEVHYPTITNNSTFVNYHEAEHIFQGMKNSGLRSLPVFEFVDDKRENFSTAGIDLDLSLKAYVKAKKADGGK